MEAAGSGREFAVARRGIRVKRDAMNGQRGIDGFRESLGLQTVSTAGTDADPSGPGSYDAVVAALRHHADHPALVALLEAAWRDRFFPTTATEGDTHGATPAHARPLLLLAALRARALAHPTTHPLSLELLHDAVAPELEARFLAALDDSELIPLLATATLPQVDPARAMAHGLPSLVTRLSHRGFDLVERFTTAGLNLVVDRTAIPFRFGTHLVQGFDFPAPEHRLGFDPAPLDLDGPTADTTIAWLTACIWPGETERLSRLKAALTHRRHAWRGDSPAPDIIATPHITWPELLAHPKVSALVTAAARPLLFIDASRPLAQAPALPPADGADGPFAALAANPQSLWLMVVRTGLAGARALRLDAILYRTGAWQRVTLGETGFHSASLTLDLSGPERLAALW